MYYQLVNSSDPEKQFAQAKNAYSTAALTVGQVVRWAYNGTDDGLAATIPATGKFALTGGVVDSSSIAISGLGRIMVYGHSTTCLVSGGTDVAVADKLTCKDAVFHLIKAISTTGGSVLTHVPPNFTAGQAFTTSTAAAKKVLVRCM